MNLQSRVCGRLTLPSMFGSEFARSRNICMPLINLSKNEKSRDVMCKSGEVNRGSPYSHFVVKKLLNLVNLKSRVFLVVYLSGKSLK